MSKVLYVYERNCPTISIMENAAERNQDDSITKRFMKASDVTTKDIDWCDVFVLTRTMDPYSVFLAKRAKESGCFVMSMYDDDLGSMPKSYPMPFYRKNCVRNALGLSEIVATCSPYIQEKYRDLTGGKRAVCVDSVVRPEEIKMIPELKTAKEGETVKIIYAANPTHIDFFNHFILPIMPKLAQRYAGKISMTFMGVKPELSQFKEKIDIEYWNTMPLDEYRQKVQDGNYDIGLSPLISNEFTKCKYFNKFIEYAMAGIVGLYSNTIPYTYVVEDGENGFLVDDDPEEWYHCLCRVIDDALLRNRCIRNAQHLLLTRFSPDGAGTKETCGIPEMIQYNAPRTPCRSIQLQRLLYLCMPVYDRIYQTIFYLSQIGVSGVWNKVKTHIRSNKAYSK